MSEGYHVISTAGGSGGRGGNFTAAPTRPRKRIYDSEVSPDEEVVARRHYLVYHEKGGVPYKKAERMSRYSRRQDSVAIPSTAAAAAATATTTTTISTMQAPATGSVPSASYDPSKSPMMEDEDVNQGLADNFDDSLCGLGSDLTSSTYNMSEALHALPPVPPVPIVKREPVSPSMENLASIGSSMALFEDHSESNSIDKLLKMLSNETSFDGGSPSPSISQLLGQSSTFSPSPPEDALSPPSLTPPPPPTTAILAAHHLYTQQHIMQHQQLQNNSHQHSQTSSPDLDEDHDTGGGGGGLPDHQILGLACGAGLLVSDGLRDDPGDVFRGFSDFDDSYSTPVSHAALNHDDNRFQYILSVPTSTAVKNSEDSLSYLNQGQSYEIKVKKLGDITTCAGNKFTSVIRICFHERRFQYTEREQLTLWHQVRPNERIIDIDMPLSYGISDVQQSKNKLALVQFDWDPSKDVAAYIKVNCISTEFTQKKHGGEKGVPFRIQIETYAHTNGTTERLYVCGCQVKVFKLKGADRKHKQDKEKISKLSVNEKDKYQESCECTIMSTYSGDMIYTPDDRWNNSSDESSYSSPDRHKQPSQMPGPSNSTAVVQKAAACVTPTVKISQTPPPHITPSPSTSTPNTTNTSPVEQRKLHTFTPCMTTTPDDCYSNTEQDSFGCNSSSSGPVNGLLEGDESAGQIQQWLGLHRFSHYTATFANFTATDILRLSRSEMIEICGLADGIRLFNALHAKNLVPRLTLYVCADGENVYSAVYLERATYRELVRKLCALFSISSNTVQEMYMQGPSGIHVKLNDEVVRNFQDECLLMCSAIPTPAATPPSVDVKCLPQSLTLLLRIQPKANTQSPSSFLGGGSSITHHVSGHGSGQVLFASCHRPPPGPVRAHHPITSVGMSVGGAGSPATTHTTYVQLPSNLVQGSLTGYKEGRLSDNSSAESLSSGVGSGRHLPPTPTSQQHHLSPQSCSSTPLSRTSPIPCSMSLNGSQGTSHFQPTSKSIFTSPQQQSSAHYHS